jgi:uncharacterized protein YdaU (DUF1376 family)
MAQFPHLPLFVDAFVADTAHLSDAEVGLYLRMLLTMWCLPRCRMPNDDAWLSRRFRKTVEQVKSELRPLIEEFCQTDGNWIEQKRLTKEHNHVTISKQKRSVAAKTKWQKEKNKHNADAPTPTPTPTPKKKEEEDTKPGSEPPVVGGDLLGQEEVIEPPKPKRGPIVFEEGVIRLNQADYDKWKAAFSYITLDADLIALAPWAQKQQNWFQAVLGALRKRNQEAAERIRSSTPVPPGSPRGIDLATLWDRGI